MRQRFNFFLLLASLLFASCHCKNADVDNGPKNEETELNYEKKEKPNFILVLAEEVKGKDLFANRPIPLVLKDENFAKHEVKVYKYPKAKAEKGVLHLMEANGKTGKRIESSDTIELKDGVLPLMFVPNGIPGKDIISLELTYKEDYFDVNTKLDLKSVVSLEVSKKVETSKLTTAWLKIIADTKEEFTLKSVRINHYAVEMTYDNGEKEGVWAEVNSVNLGDKFKGGEHELSLKLYGVHDKVQPGAYQPIEVLKAVNALFLRSVDLEMVLVDSKGNEYKTKAEFDVNDISFEVSTGDIEWGIYKERSDKSFKEGIFKFDFKIKGKLDGWDEYFKLLSFRSNDGSAVSLLNYMSEDVVGQTFKGSNFPSLHFRFDEMNLDHVKETTILTIKVKGPGGAIKSADLVLGPDEKELILWKRIEWVEHRAIYLTRELADSVKYKEPSYEAEKYGKLAVELLEQVKFMGSQINPKFLSKYFSPSRLRDIESALKWINHLKGGLKDLNKEFGFNFQSPI